MYFNEKLTNRPGIKIDLRIKDTININQLINVFQSKTQIIQFTNIFKNSIFYMLHL